MAFWLYSLPFAGLATVVSLATKISLLPTSMGFSFSRKTLPRHAKTIRNPAIAMSIEDASLWFPTEGPSFINAASFFKLAGVNLDKRTLHVKEPIEDYESLVIYTAMGSVVREQEGNTISVTINWSVDGVFHENDDDEQKLLQAFEGILTHCSIEYGTIVFRAVHTVEELREAILEGPSGLDAGSFFEAAGVDLDTQTFLFSPGKDRKENSSPWVYSAEASVPGKSITRINWTIAKALTGEDIKNNSSDLEQILKAFEGIITNCWVFESDSDGNNVQRDFYTPQDLKVFLEAQKPKEKSAISWVSPEGIDVTSVKLNFFFDRDGYLSEVFSANLKEGFQFAIQKQKEPTLWWRTRYIHLDRNPYGAVAEVWTGDEFPRKVLSYGADKQITFSRQLAINLKQFAYLALRCISDIPSVGRRKGSELPSQIMLEEYAAQPSRAVERLAHVASTFLFLVAGPLRMSWRKFWQDIFMAGLVKNGTYIRSIMIFYLCVIVVNSGFVDMLRRKWPLRKNSPFVERLITLSIALQSMGIFSRTVLGFVVMLLRLPILAFLNLLSTVTKFCQSKRRITKRVRFDGAIRRFMDGRFGSTENYPPWFAAILFAPLWEELFFRFVFDKGWHGFFRLSNLAPRGGYSPSIQQGWIWANSLLFGLMHAANWFPSPSIVQERSKSLDGDESEDDYWENLFHALFHSTGAFLTAFFVFNPLYVRHGLSGSICAHAAVNSVAVAGTYLLSFLLESREEDRQEQLS